MKSLRDFANSSGAAVIWLTGLPGSGKSTLAERVCNELKKRQKKCENFDGDIIRAAFPLTGFSEQERKLHICRIGFFAAILERNDVFVVVSLVSPYEEARAQARSYAKRFIEVYLSTPLAVCEKRDPKGMYAKARKGLIQHFTGIDDPYEPPTHPEITIDTSVTSIEDSVRKIIERIDAE